MIRKTMPTRHRRRPAGAPPRRATGLKRRRTRMLQPDRSAGYRSGFRTGYREGYEAGYEEQYTDIRQFVPGQDNHP